MRRFRLTAFVALVLGATSPRAAVRLPQASDWRVAFRVDDTRFAVMTMGDEGAITLRQRDVHALTTPTYRASAQFLGTVFEIPGDRLAEIVPRAVPPAGQQWILDAGRDGAFALTVERYVIAEVECDERWGVLLAASPADAPRLARVREKYFVARPARADEPLAGATSVGPIAVTLTATQRSTLESLLRTRVSSGLQTARLDYDVQAFRLTPDGDPRLFVRSEWRVAGRIESILGAWVRLRGNGDLEIERVDDRASALPGNLRGMGVVAGREYVGLVLNVVDTDRDGWGEVLVSRDGYESRVIDVVEYPERPGSSPHLITTWATGC
jgi:hypothetical protein